MPILTKRLKQKIFERFGTIMLVAVMAQLALAVSIQAAQPTVTINISERQQAAAAAFWTRARIAAAPALALPVDKGANGIDSAALNAFVDTGPAGTEPPGAAEPDAAQIARAVFAQDWATLEEADEENALDAPMGTFGVHTFYDVNTHTALWTIFPHRWDGRLTFRTATGTSSCSATVISGNNIVTAAHCVYDTAANRFYNTWVFVPAYRNGSTPFGTFTARSCTVLTAWVNLPGAFAINTHSRHDVAVCKMNNNAAGQTLNGAVGWAGRMWNASNQQLVFNSGYPARDFADVLLPSSTQFLRACTAETFLQTTDTLGSGCSYGRGISGGSWLVNYKPLVVSGNVNSVNSGLFIGQRNLYGARFTSNNIVLLCNAQAC